MERRPIPEMKAVSFEKFMDSSSVAGSYAIFCLNRKIRLKGMKFRKRISDPKRKG
jgi:hypothetical protein